MEKKHKLILYNPLDKTTREYTPSTIGPLFRNLKKLNYTIESYYKEFLLEDKEGICYCGKPTTFRGLQYGYSEYCSSRCANLDPKVLKKSKLTNLIKTGYEHNSMNPANEVKRKNTCLEKYGVDHACKSDITKEKIRVTCFEEYGSKSFLSSDTMKEILVAMYGVDNIFKHEDYQNKAKVSRKKNSKLRFEMKCFPSNYILRGLDTDMVEYTCDKGHENSSTRQLVYKRFRIGNVCCETCNPLYSNQESSGERKLREFISSIYDGKVEKLQIVKEIDVYLPELKLGFEYNGIRWHSEAVQKPKNYHKEKTELFESHGIHLIHIYEDDAIYKKDIIESRIKNLLKINPNKIFARKCSIKEISSKEHEDFMENNHIQGKVTSKIRLGLFYKEELVSCMSFSVPRMNKKYEYELLRFANKLNTSVVGGASKLFSYFIKNHNPSSIISYADRSWSKGKLYESLGFKYEGKTDPNYSYIIKGIRQDRFKFRKSELVKQGFDESKTEKEIMMEREIMRIYDSGSLIYSWQK